MQTYPLDPLLYHAHHLLRADDLTFWQTLATTQGDPILELGCGTGRILLTLAGMGYRVTGLDADPNMLAYLHTSLTSALPNLTILEGDMRTFSLPERFAQIILPCNTYSTFPSRERKQILQTIRRHLQPGGTFTFSSPNPAILLDLEPTSDFDFEDEFPHPETGHPVEVYSSWARTGETVTFLWRYDHLFPNGNTSDHIASTSHFLDPIEQYLAELHEAGLSLLTEFGDFEYNPYASDSPYWIVTTQAMKHPAR